MKNGLQWLLVLLAGLSAPAIVSANVEALSYQGARPWRPDVMAQASTPDPNADCPKGQCIIDTYINPAIKVGSALVGVLVTISIAVGGIQYASSGNDPQKVTAAKQRITKALVALVAFFLLFAFLNYLIPGGVGL